MLATWQANVSGVRLLRLDFLRPFSQSMKMRDLRTVWFPLGKPAGSKSPLLPQHRQGSTPVQKFKSSTCLHATAGAPVQKFNSSRFNGLKADSRSIAALTNYCGPFQKPALSPVEGFNRFAPFKTFNSEMQPGQSGVTLLDLPGKTQLPWADDPRVRGRIKAVVVLSAGRGSTDLSAKRQGQSARCKGH